MDESAIAELSGQVEAANQLLLNKQREMEQVGYWLSVSFQRVQLPHNNCLPETAPIKPPPEVANRPQAAQTLQPLFEPAFVTPKARYDEQLAAIRSDLEDLARKMQELRGVRSVTAEQRFSPCHALLCLGWGLIWS